MFPQRRRAKDVAIFSVHQSVPPNGNRRNNKNSVNKSYLDTYFTNLNHLIYFFGKFFKT